MAANQLLDGSPVMAWDPTLMVPALTLVGALLVGAVVVAFFRRWQQRQKPLSPSASDQLAQFRQLYEQGAISEEEFLRLRTVLGGEIRKAADLPARPPQPSIAPEVPQPPAVPDTATEPPADPGPPSGIRPS